VAARYPRTGSGLIDRFGIITLAENRSIAYIRFFDELRIRLRRRKEPEG